jgi:hypothetical protein
VRFVEADAEHLLDVRRAADALLDESAYRVNFESRSAAPLRHDRGIVSLV